MQAERHGLRDEENVNYRKNINDAQSSPAMHSQEFGWHSDAYSRLIVGGNRIVRSLQVSERAYEG